MPYSGPAHFAVQLLCLCRPSFLCLSFASLLVLPCGARVIVLSLCSCGLAVFLGFALLAVLVRALLFPVLSAFLCCGSCLCPFCLPCPAGSLICTLVQLAPRCAGASLWVSGCICDGPVALLYARSVVKLCYPSVIRFMATKATRPVWGFHPLHHVTGDVGELSLVILRYSSTDDPGPY